MSQAGFIGGPLLLSHLQPATYGLRPFPKGVEVPERKETHSVQMKAREIDSSLLGRLRPLFAQRRSPSRTTTLRSRMERTENGGIRPVCKELPVAKNESKTKVRRLRAAPRHHRRPTNFLPHAFSTVSAPALALPTAHNYSLGNN